MSRARDLADLGDGIAVADLPSDVVTTASPSLGRRNLIINGAMQVAQRATSVTGQTANGYLTLDRYRVNASGGTVNSSQQPLTVGQTDLPSSFKYFQRFEATTANDNMGVQQKIEDATIVSGEKVTFSFYAKGTNPAGGHLDVRLQQDFGTGGSSAVNPTPESLTLTSSWQRFTYVFDVPSISGKTVGTNSNINFAIRQPDDDDTTTAWTLDTTGWQVEIGSVASSYEHRSYGEELALCQRYYTKSYGQGTNPGTATIDGSVGRHGVAGTATTGEMFTSTVFKVEMRGVPTVLAYDTSGNSAKCNVTNFGVADFNNQTCNEVHIQTSGCHFQRPSGSAGCAITVHYTAEAEL